jgi:hydrogenase expression/formation protein HypE
LPVGKLPGALLGQIIGEHHISDESVIVGPGIGFDAAALAVGGEVLVAKSDPITFATDRAASYLVNVNANDLACLGATPRWLLVTALLPEGRSTPSDIREMFVELSAECSRRGISLVGGHTEVTQGLTRPLLIGQMLGTTTRERLLKPGEAKAGDRLLLTRPIAIEGTSLLARELGDRLAMLISPQTVDSAAALLDDPGISVVDDATALLRTGAVRALHDPTEGGIAMGLREIATASGCGLVVSEAAIPILAQTREIAAALHLDPLGLLASGSLLAAIDPEQMDVVDAICRESNIPAAWIGKLAPVAAGFRIRRGDAYSELPEFVSDEVTRVLS